MKPIFPQPPGFLLPQQVNAFNMFDWLILYPGAFITQIHYHIYTTATIDNNTMHVAPTDNKLGLKI